MSIKKLAVRLAAVGAAGGSVVANAGTEATTLASSISFADATTATVAICGLLAGFYVTMKGLQFVIHKIKSA